MRIITLITTILFSVACGTDDRSRIKITETEEVIKQCSVIQAEESAVIVCPDGTTATVTPETIEVIREVEVPVVTERVIEVETEVPVITEKVIKIHSDPIYVGYYCSRNVIKIGHKVYLISSGLVRLGKKWTYVSNNCDIRYKNGQVQTK